jgi:hypothetical protein
MCQCWWRARVPEGWNNGIKRLATRSWDLGEASMLAFLCGLAASSEDGCT